MHSPPVLHPDGKNPWPETSAMATLMRILSQIPEECFTRQQRERLMESLIQKIVQMGTDILVVTPPSWRLVLGVMIRAMRRPTFYQVCLS